jgi:hypothetical protein
MLAAGLSQFDQMHVASMVSIACYVMLCFFCAWTDVDM